MPEDRVPLTRPSLKTPRAAAVAGIIFAVLLSTSYVLLRVSIPADPLDGGEWLDERTGAVTFALSLVPFAGIAFLWFIGVVRDQLGELEDRFFSTVFFGSGLLFLATTFVAAAIGGGLLTSYAIAPVLLIEGGVYTFARAMMYRVSNVYAIRMAGTFMLSLATIWVRLAPFFGPRIGQNKVNACGPGQGLIRRLDGISSMDHSGNRRSFL